MATSLNLRADRELWKYIFVKFPFASSFHLSQLPDYNHVWAEELYNEDPIVRTELLTPRQLKIIRSIERTAMMMGFRLTEPLSAK